MPSLDKFHGHGSVLHHLGGPGIGHYGDEVIALHVEGLYARQNGYR